MSSRAGLRSRRQVYEALRIEIILGALEHRNACSSGIQLVYSKGKQSSPIVAGLLIGRAAQKGATNDFIEWPAPNPG